MNCFGTAVLAPAIRPPRAACWMIVLRASLAVAAGLLLFKRVQLAFSPATGAERIAHGARALVTRL